MFGMIKTQPTPLLSAGLVCRFPNFSLSHVLSDNIKEERCVGSPVVFLYAVNGRRLFLMVSGTKRENSVFYMWYIAQGQVNKTC